MILLNHFSNEEKLKELKLYISDYFGLTQDDIQFLSDNLEENLKGLKKDKAGDFRFGFVGREIDEEAQRSETTNLNNQLLSEEDKKRHWEHFHANDYKLENYAIIKGEWIDTTNPTNRQEKLIKKELEDYVANNIKSWNKKAPVRLPLYARKLRRYIEQKGMTDSACYNGADVAKSTFNNYINGKNNNPSKNILLALTITLGLNMEETEDVLNAAGFTFRKDSMFDVVIQWCISKEIKSVVDANWYLEQMGCETMLGKRTSKKKEKE